MAATKRSRGGMLLRLACWTFVFVMSVRQIAVRPGGSQGFHGFVGWLWAMTAPLVIAREIYTWMKEPDEQR